MHRTDRCGADEKEGDWRQMDLRTLSDARHLTRAYDVTVCRRECGPAASTGIIIPELRNGRGAINRASWS
jgi:hypothetical protein